MRHAAETGTSGLLALLPALRQAADGCVAMVGAALQSRCARRWLARSHGARTRVLWTPMRAGRGHPMRRMGY